MRTERERSIESLDFESFWFCFRVWIDENKKLLHHRDTKKYSRTLVRELKPWKGVIPKKCARARSTKAGAGLKILTVLRY